MGTVHNIADRMNPRLMIGRYAMKLKVAADIHDLFSFYPVRALEEATQAADRVIDCGGDAQAALDAADAVLWRRYAPSCEEDRSADEAQRNAARLACYQQRRIQRIDLLWDSLQQTIQARMVGRPLESVAAAILRARHALQGGSTAAQALYDAVGDDDEQTGAP